MATRHLLLSSPVASLLFSTTCGRTFSPHKKVLTPLFPIVHVSSTNPRTLCVQNPVQTWGKSWALGQITAGDVGNLAERHSKSEAVTTQLAHVYKSYQARPSTRFSLSAMSESWPGIGTTVLCCSLPMSPCVWQSSREECRIGEPTERV